MLIQKKSDLFRRQNKIYGRRISDINNQKIISLTAFLIAAAYLSNYHLTDARSALAVNHHFNVIGVQRAINWLIGGGLLGLFTSFIHYNHIIFKRALDLISAVLGLLLLTPLFAVVAALIKLDSRGPVFFTQVRLGKNGKPFNIVKFRTMRQDAEERCGAVWARKRDPRITQLGHYLRSYHIDELPQLINVVLGDMSLIGPRPERPQLADVIEKEVSDFGQRLEVKPGITGLAQVRYQYGDSIKDARRKLKYDLIYRDRQCWSLDFLIAFWTLEKIFIGEKSR